VSKISQNLLRGVFIRAARSILGVTLYDVGQQVKMSPGAVGKWENNEAPIKDAIFNKLSDFFSGNGISVDLSSPDKLVVTVDKKALKIISKDPRHPEYQTLDDIIRERIIRTLDKAILERIAQEYLANNNPDNPSTHPQ